MHAAWELHEAAEGDGVELEIPGLVNAHTHLELGHLAGRVPGGEGLPAWVQRLFAQPERPSAEIEATMAASLVDLADSGTTGLLDVANTTRSTRLLAESDLEGTVQRELFGWDPQRWSLALATVAAEGAPPGQDALHLVPTAHSTYSCSAELLAAVLSDTAAPPRTLHVAEDASELTFLRKAEGPWAELLDFLGRPWQGRHLRARSPVGLLHQLGVLGPHLGLVHCVWVDDEDLDIIAETGATVVLCPRSNLFIGGRLPPVPAMVRRGIPLALGTDSLASGPDLDVLLEAAALRSAFPGVDPQVWLDALTVGGARLMGRSAPPQRVRVSLPEDAQDDPLGRLFDGTAWPRRVTG